MKKIYKGSVGVGVSRQSVAADKGVVPPTPCKILLEDGGSILLEDGGKLLRETCVDTTKTK